MNQVQGRPKIILITPVLHLRLPREVAMVMEDCLAPFSCGVINNPADI